MEKAVILDIQRYCIHDGPGIRTTVFFKGCHMACKWCHNPESQRREPEMMFYRNACIDCGECEKFCGRGAISKKGEIRSLKLQLCLNCEKKSECAENCPAGALKLCGILMTVEEIFREVLRDKNFYGPAGEDNLSSGGVTCSGGEPLLWGEFLAMFLKLCKTNSISTCVDTTLNLPWEWVNVILPYTDLILADLKFMDDSAAIRFTGRDYQNARDNLQKLSALGEPVIIRIPLVPGVNDTPSEEEKRDKFISSLKNVLRVDKFYVSNHAANKYLALNRENWLEGPTK